ncbi:chorismate-binding protein [Frankia sp. AiPa1]|uniref:chorismate-binding protein n=1 Tax=Frankia sp. AiPa1 TaxID=573492 RepID=UPI00202B5A0B|nr:chorismate-binding protein [Frankia sp. AiPa1]MCL9758018.1 chorismate-binding protein [Frankia sp. AiPa1]
MVAASGPSRPYLLAGGRLATGVLEITDDLAVLDRDGFWAVVVDFEGAVRCVRFADVVPAPVEGPAALRRRAWQGPSAQAWTSSLDQAAYLAGADAIRAHIAAGDVYEVNLCRVLSAPLPTPGDPPSGHPSWSDARSSGTRMARTRPHEVPDHEVPDGAQSAAGDPAALAAVLAAGNPAPYAVVLDVPEAGLRIAGASPELFLERDGDLVRSGPIKGTGRTVRELGAKDVAENIMIVDLVRNDFGRVALPGSVTVPALCAVEHHPGLVHLVSTVQARLRPAVGWVELLAAASPAGSVSGAPKSSALRIIGELEPGPRGPYCGGIGWVDADRRTGWLCVGIRTFWFDEGRLHFGTGAAITWDSDPADEWRETELKAARLVRLASG